MNCSSMETVSSTTHCYSNFAFPLTIRFRAGLLDQAIEQVTFSGVKLNDSNVNGLVLGLVKKLLTRLRDAGHALRIVFMAAYNLDTCQFRQKLRNELRSCLLQKWFRLDLVQQRSEVTDIVSRRWDWGPLAITDDHEFIVTYESKASGDLVPDTNSSKKLSVDQISELEIPPLPEVTIRRREAGYEKSGEAGYVAHAWDASFSYYLRVVRPAALMMYVPNELGHPGFLTPEDPSLCLLVAELHYCLRFVGIPIFALSSINGLRASHGRLHGFVFENDRLRTDVASLTKIVEAHALISEKFANKVIAEAKENELPEVGFERAPADNAPLEYEGISEPLPEGMEPLKALEWATDVDYDLSSVSNAKSFHPWYQLAEIANFSARKITNIVKGSLEAMSYLRYPNRDPLSERRRMTYIQRLTLRNEQTAKRFDIFVESLLGGRVAQVAIKETSDPSEKLSFQPSTGSRPTAAMARRQFEGLRATAMTAVKEKKFASALYTITGQQGSMGYKPCTLPWKYYLRVEDCEEDARAIDLEVCMFVSEVTYLQWEEENSKLMAKGADDFAFEDTDGKRLDAYAAQHEATAQAYVIIERILREFLPSFFSEDKIEPAPWPWNQAAVELASGAVGTHKDFLLGDQYIDHCFALARRLISLAANDSLTDRFMALLVKHFTKRADEMDRRSPLHPKFKRIVKDLEDFRSGSKLPDVKNYAIPEQDAFEFSDDFEPEDDSEFPREESWSWVRFQLKHMAGGMPRPIGKSADKRVQFRPDEWQRRMLDAVDAGNSTFVVAPTSSGKTFAAFYVMEQVLQMPTIGDKFGIVIYVAPSKGLVSQIYNEANARYKKGPTETRTGVEYNSVVSGFATKGYHLDAMHSQVLACVPETFEALLLSAHQQEWADRIKWVIFDEVHNIDSSMGHIWERLLLAIDTPFLALSATVSGLENFGAWLQYIEHKRNRNLSIVIHNERYNGLSYSIWVPRGQPQIEDVEAGAADADIAMEEKKETPEESAITLRTIPVDSDGVLRPTQHDMLVLFRRACNEIKAEQSSSLLEAAKTILSETGGDVKQLEFVLSKSKKAPALEDTKAGGEEDDEWDAPVVKKKSKKKKAVVVDEEAEEDDDYSAPVVKKKSKKKTVSLDDEEEDDDYSAPVVKKKSKKKAVTFDDEDDDPLVVEKKKGREALAAEEEEEENEVKSAMEAAISVAKERNTTRDVMAAIQADEDDDYSAPVAKKESKKKKKLLDDDEAPVPAATKANKEVVPSTSVVPDEPASKTPAYFATVHPVAALTRQALADGANNASSLDHLTLLPEDGLFLYDIMETKVRELYGAVRAKKAVVPEISKLATIIKECNPYTSFPHMEFDRITMRQADAWSKLVLQGLCKIAAVHLETAFAIVRALRKTILNAFAFSDSEISRRGASFLYRYFPQLIASMKRENRLPCIVFNTEQNVLESLADALCNRLTESEINQRRKKLSADEGTLREQRAEMAARLESLQSRKNKAKGKDRDRLRSKTRDDYDREIQELERDIRMIDNVLSEPSPEDVKLVYGGPSGDPPSFKEMSEIYGKPVDMYARRWRFLRRGIALHHSAVNAQYDAVACHFFRLGRIGVMLSSEDLAQGMNMPAKSVVIAGNSIRFTGPLVKQMAGRAGRRGLDLRGNVVFFGMPSWRVMQLLSSPFPPLRATKPTDTAALQAVMMKRFLLMQKRAAKEVVAAAGAAMTRALTMDLETALSYWPKFKAVEDGTLETLAEEERNAKIMARGEDTFKAISTAMKQLGMAGERPTMLTPVSGLVHSIGYLGPPAFAIVHLLQSGSLQNIVSAAWDTARERASRGRYRDIESRAHLESELALCYTLSRLVFSVPGYRYTKQVPETPAEETQVFCKQFNDLEPNFALGNKTVQSIANSLTLLSKQGKYVCPGWDVNEVLSNPFNPYIFIFYVVKGGRPIVRIESGLDDDVFFENFTDFISTLNILGDALALRLIGSKVVTMPQESYFCPAIQSEGLDEVEQEEQRKFESDSGTLAKRNQGVFHLNKFHEAFSAASEKDRDGNPPPGVKPEATEQQLKEIALANALLRLCAKLKYYFNRDDVAMNPNFDSKTDISGNPYARILPEFSAQITSLFSGLTTYDKSKVLSEYVVSDKRRIQ